LGVTHYDGCFGCGPSRDCGLRVDLAGTGDGALAGRFAVEDRHQGPPGHIHGGILATLLDEAMALVLHAEGTFALTRRLEVDLLAPVPLGSELDVEARVARREGRKLWLLARASGGEGPVAEARGLFLGVEPS
jgi:uncharacterized protein (TIGR00369 family)